MTRTAVILLLLCGCSTLTPPVEVDHQSVEWTQDVGPWFSQDSALQKYEIGLRSDGVLVWRSAVAAQDAAEALRQWREYEARKFEQHQIDLGSKWQAGYPPQGEEGNQP